jgi:hypothetical protein
MAAQSSSNVRDVYIYLLITNVGYPIDAAEVIRNLRRKGTTTCSPAADAIAGARQLVLN